MAVLRWNQGKWNQDTWGPSADVSKPGGATAVPPPPPAKVRTTITPSAQANRRDT